MSSRNERGVALVTALITLASMALLMTGVYTLVSDSTRSAGKNTRFQETKALGGSAMGQVAALIDRVAAVQGQPSAPGGYGVAWDQADFGAFIRDELSRASASGAPAPCTQNDPDISYTVQTNQGPAEVSACITRAAAGGIAGSGGNVVFARVNKGTADKQSLFEVTVWVKGSNAQARSQRQASIRAFY